MNVATDANDVRHFCQAVTCIYTRSKVVLLPSRRCKRGCTSKTPCYVSPSLLSSVDAAALYASYCYPSCEFADTASIALLCTI